MPQSHSTMLIHLVFSTKNRFPFINDTLRPDLHQYMAGTINNAKCQCIEINTMPDHAHILVDLSRNISVADLIRTIKSNSSGWVHEKPNARKSALAKFYWQAGYGAFSVSESSRMRVIKYIRNQREHHLTQGFQDEYRSLLTKHRYFMG